MLKLMFSKFFRNSKLFIGTLISIILTMGIIGACLNLVSGTITSTDYGQRFNNVDVVISMPQKYEISYKDDDKIKTERVNLSQKQIFSTDKLNKILSFKNVEEFILDKSFYINITNVSNVFGHNFDSYKLSGFEIQGENPNENEIVIDEILQNSLKRKIGDKLKINTKDGMKEFTISGIAIIKNHKIYKLQNFVFFNESDADILSDGVYNVGIKTKNITDIINQAKSQGVNCFYGKNINKAEFNFLIKEYFSPMIVFITMGSICLLASIFVIFGTIMFSVKHRSREVGLLRTLGMSKGQLGLMLILENFIISIIGILIGGFLSIPIAKLICSLFVQLGIIDTAFKISVNMLMQLIAGGGILLVIILVALLVGGKSIKISAMQALKEEDPTTRKGLVARLISGVILFGGGIAIILSTPYYAGLGVGMAFCSCGLFLGSALLFAPFLMKIINGLLSIFTKQMNNSLGRVANANVKVKASKFAIASISLALMFSLNAVMFLNNYSFIQDNASNRMNFFAENNYYIKNVVEDEALNKGLKVKANEILYESNNKVNSAVAFGVSNYDKIAHELINGKLPINENEIIISTTIKKLEVGQNLKIILPNGQEKICKISGQYKYKYAFNFESGIPDIILNDNLLIDSSFNKSYDFVYFNFSEAEKQEFLQSNLGKSYKLYENSLNAYKNSVEFDVQMGAIYLMLIITIALSIVALFNTFAMIMNVRKKEFNGLRLIGANKKQIIKMTIIETLIVVLTGLTIGVFFTALCVAPFSINSFGKFDFIVLPKMFFGLLGITGVLGILAGILPSVIVVRQLRKQMRNE